MLKPIAAALGLALVCSQVAAEGTKVGRNEYMIACAGCHGETAKGDGPLAGLLKIETPDLTRLAERAGGTFPFETVVTVIDGRGDVRAHGSKMPVWGKRYFGTANVDDYAYPEEAELVAQGRILSLANYLSSIQQ